MQNAPDSGLKWAYICNAAAIYLQKEERQLCIKVSVPIWLSTPTLIQWAGLRALLCAGYAGTRHKILGKCGFVFYFLYFSMNPQCPVFCLNVLFSSAMSCSVSFFPPGIQISVSGLSMDPVLLCQGSPLVFGFRICRLETLINPMADVRELNRTIQHGRYPVPVTGGVSAKIPRLL